MFPVHHKCEVVFAEAETHVAGNDIQVNAISV